MFNLNQLMAFDPLNIKQVDVLANRYYQARRPTRAW